jgi:predicted nucleotidyltransferase component of viral defense system
MKNIGVSLYEKIRNQARAGGMETSVVLRRYIQERFLYRISVSKFSDEFCLKGGILLSAYNDGELLRPSEDIDLNGMNGQIDIKRLEEVLRSIVSQVVPEDDGVSFDLSSMRVLKDRTGAIPGGKVSVIATLHTARVPLKIDVGFGNVITPDAKPMEIPTLLSGEVPRPIIKSYPLETVIAEKLHAMAQFGAENTRVKDYYDIHRLCRKVEFFGDTVTDAIRRTFAHQGRDIPEEMSSLTSSYSTRHGQRWDDLLETPGIEYISFTEAMNELTQFIVPLLAAARGVAAPPELWQPGIGWGPAPANGLQMR